MALAVYGRCQYALRTLASATGSFRINKKRAYHRGTDEDKAYQFLQSYHEATKVRFGSSHQGKLQRNADAPKYTIPTLHPPELHDAILYNKWRYFCELADTTPKLVRYKLSTQEKEVLFTSHQLNSSCRVTEVTAPQSSPKALSQPAKIAVLIQSDMFRVVVIINEADGKFVKALPDGHQVQWVDEAQLFFTTMNNSLRVDKAHFLNLRCPQNSAELIYTSHRADEVVSVACTKDRRYTTVNANCIDTSKVYLLDNTKPSTPCTADNLICDHHQNYKFYLEHRDGVFYGLLASASSPNLSLHFSKAFPKDISQFVPFPDAPTGVVHEFESFKRGIVLYTSDEMKQSIVLIDESRDPIIRTISFPESVSLIEPNNHSFDQEFLDINVYSYTKPMKQFKVSFTDFKISPRRLITRGKYEMVRYTVPSSNNCGVPLTLIGREDAMNKETPCLVLVYGCYNQQLNYSFMNLPNQLLEKGWKVALCHVRGGGELGLTWYEGGKGEHKRNAIVDTLNCIKFLHEFKLSSPSQTVLQSFSAGGVVAANAILAIPGIANSLVLRMPFLDLVTTFANPHLFLTEEERLEWCGEGSTDSHRSICPCSGEGKLGSHVYLTVGAQDARVPVWHAANFIKQKQSSKFNVYVNVIPGDHSSFDETATMMELDFMLSSVKKTGKVQEFFKHFKFS